MRIAGALPRLGPYTVQIFVRPGGNATDALSAQVLASQLPVVIPGNVLTHMKRQPHWKFALGAQIRDRTHSQFEPSGQAPEFTRGLGRQCGSDGKDSLGRASDDRSAEGRKAGVAAGAASQPPSKQ